MKYKEIKPYIVDAIPVNDVLAFYYNKVSGLPDWIVKGFNDNLLQFKNGTIFFKCKGVFLGTYPGQFIIKGIRSFYSLNSEDFLNRYEEIQ